jgi:hypothetical protein
MSSSQFLDDICLQDLGTGSGMVVWGFRSAARGQGGCVCVVRGFERVLGFTLGRTALTALHDLAGILGTDAGRRIQLAMPGSVRLVHDEGLLLHAIAAAQAGDCVMRDASLARLMMKIPGLRLSASAEQVADCFKDAGLLIEAPRNLAMPFGSNTAGPASHLPPAHFFN